MKSGSTTIADRFELFKGQYVRHGFTPGGLSLNSPANIQRVKPWVEQSLNPARLAPSYAEISDYVVKRGQVCG